MKLLYFNCLIAVLIISAQAARAQHTDDASDQQFSLRGALDLFKRSSSPENFEELLNRPGNTVNNLDLNNDGKVDYIRVMDRKNKDVHALILQIPVNADENQDVAVIEIERTGSESAILQIIGDEEIFGRQVIAEPAEEKPEGDAFIIDDVGNGPNAPFNIYSTNRIIVNVWFWPSVRLIFGPRYTIWISPYRWGRWPAWYNPWTPLPRYTWKSRRFYDPLYVIVDVRRTPRAHRMYREYRREYGRSRYDRGYSHGDGSRRRRR